MESKLQELESASSHTASRISALKTQHKRCLILVNNQTQLPQALQWIQSHGLDVKDLIIVQESEELDSPLILKVEPESEEIMPLCMTSTIQTIYTSMNQPIGLTIYALPSLQLTTMTVDLLRDNLIDFALIVGCHSLTRGQYESFQGANPFIEEIILKQAVQPVILFK